MTEEVDSKESKDASSLEQSKDQAATTAQPAVVEKPSETGTMPSQSDPSDGAQDDTMLDAPAEPDADADSEAETLIQSPEKQRTATDNTSAVGSASATRKDEDSTAEVTATENDTSSRKRKRSAEDELTSGSSRRSSPLSSPRSSSRVPPHWLEIDSDASISKYIGTNPAWPQGGSDAADSDNPDPKTVKNATRKRRPSDILPPISKHRSKNSSGGVDPGSIERRETRSATYPRHNSEDRSPSPRPQRREHKRGLSTQSSLGDVERKKRGRPPAIHTRRGGSAEVDRPRSVSSDDSDSPQQNRSSSQKFSAADHDTMSPAKVPTGPRKFRDKNGRTFLSRAASNNDVVAARARFAERPEDLNVPDNAGNTPLQIAALQGYVDIVKFLLENGCDVDTRNIDKDTALIDAVENGHVEVIKLLLDHGANPRLGNRKGDEPYELVPLDDENYQEIRTLLAAAKDKKTTRRISVENPDTSRDGASSRAASAASPRDSPPMMGPRSPPAGFGRRRTGRSESTRNDLLWQENTQENLKKLASQGDVQGVANILNVLQKASTESLIAAAKAGHEEVLQYLLAMGNTEPDPDPIRHLKIGYNTPLLAAIGRGHPEVVKLLVEQSGFNPMKKLLKGKAYYEISAERRGEQWQKEYEILKSAYDKYAVKHRKATSARATRDSEKLKARANSRRSQSPVLNKPRNSSSPTLTHKQLPTKSPRSAHKDRDRETGSVDGAERRKTHAPKRDLGDSSVAVASDQDQTINTSRKAHVKRRSQSDFSQQSNLDSEVTHRRRRLVTGKEHRRRKSNADGSSDEEMVSIKTEGKSNVLLKRTRDSVSPAAEAPEETGTGRSAAKKRRTVIESSPEETRPGQRKNSNLSSSPARERKTQDPAVVKRDKSKPAPSVQEEPPEPPMDVDKPAGEDQAESSEIPVTTIADSDVPLQRIETTKEIKSESVDNGPSEAELHLQKQLEEQEARKAEEARRMEEERLAAEKVAEEQRLAEEAERLRKAEEEAAAALRKKEEEERQERLKRELEEKQRRQEEQLREQQRREEEMLREQRHREQLEAEQRRREALPALLRHCALLVDNSDPKATSEAWLKLFVPLFTVRSAQFNSNPPNGDKEEIWIPNWQVAGLLATKDLTLGNYTSLQKRPVTKHEQECMWRVGRNRLAYEFLTNQWNTSIKQANQREKDERPKFLAMSDLFWVKVCCA
jgi:ankyrin repeat protein